jgi:hypothetical protein
MDTKAPMNKLKIQIFTKLSQTDTYGIKSNTPKKYKPAGTRAIIIASDTEKLAFFVILNIRNKNNLLSTQRMA